MLGQDQYFHNGCRPPTGDLFEISVKMQIPGPSSTHSIQIPLCVSVWSTEMYSLMTSPDDS